MGGFIIKTLFNKLKKLKDMFISKSIIPNEVDTANINSIENNIEILSNEDIHSPKVNVQLLFKVNKQTLDVLNINPNNLMAKFNSIYIDNFLLSITEKIQKIEIDNPCGANLPKIASFCSFDEKELSARIQFNAFLTKHDSYLPPDQELEVYDFSINNLFIPSFEYCSSNIPNPTVYDFIPSIKTATTLITEISSINNLDYYVYAVDVEGEIYLAPLVTINQDSSTLIQLNLILNKDSTNTQFSLGELASINKLEYANISPLNLYLNNFNYFLNLSELRIENCSYTNLPDKICNLPKLTKLYLKNNLIQTNLDNIARLTKLEILDLSFNNLSVIPYNLANLNSLQELYLNHNQIYNLSLFKDMNVFLHANDQIISRTVTNMLSSPTFRYELNIEFLRDVNDKIPHIDFISNSGWEDIINGEHYIVWMPTNKPMYMDVHFSSTSSLQTFNGFIHVSIIG